MSKTSTTVADINTNPFTRAFNGLGHLFRYNQPWGIICLVLGILGSWTMWPSTQPVDRTTTDSTVISEGSTLAWSFLLLVIVISVAIIVTTYVNGVLAYVAWKTGRAEKAGFGEAFGAVTKRFWSLLGAEVISSVKIIGGLLLFVIPGIRAALRYHVVLMTVFDEELTASQAVQRTKELTKNHLLEILGIVTMTMIPFVGLALDVGGRAVIYPELKAMLGSKGPLPKVHWLNYFGIVLLGLLFSIFGLLALALRSVS